MKLELRQIIDGFKKLTSGKWKDRRQYLEVLHKEGKVSINGFIFQEDTYCWLIWKPTDIGNDTQWKGEPLLMIVPFTTVESHDWGAIKRVLEAQNWTYM